MKCQILVDWLTFSVKRKEPKEVIVEFLGLESSTFPALFRLLAAEEGANISRIDIACDDREGHLDMDEIVQKIQSNQVNSRMAKRSVTVSYDGPVGAEPRFIWVRPPPISGCAFTTRQRRRESTATGSG